MPGIWMGGTVFTENLLPRDTIPPPVRNTSPQHRRAILVNHTKIMGDKENGRFIFPLQFIHQAENLCLNRHIQRRSRFVSDTAAEDACQCHGNHHTLPHPTGKLVGVSPSDICSVRNPYCFQHLRGFLQSLPSVQP